MSGVIAVLPRCKLLGEVLKGCTPAAHGGVVASCIIGRLVPSFL